MLKRLLAALALLLPVAALAQSPVTGRVEITHPHDGSGNNGNVVVWLTPAGNSAAVHPAEKPFVLQQKNKSFEPHLLVIPVGATVDFPNLDPFFHNVFSLYNGKRFDLGLYEAGSSRSVRFTRPGVSYIFCNIHPEMSAVVVTLATPYYAVTSASGEFAIGDVPPGDYKLHVWYERGSAEELAKAGRQISVPAGKLAPIIIAEALNLPTTHKNKYGRDYDTTTPYEPAH